MFPTTFPTQENIISSSDSPCTSSDFLGTAWDIAETAPTHLQEIVIAMREFLMENRERRSLERRSSSPRNGRAEATDSDRSAKSSPFGRKADFVVQVTRRAFFRIYRRNAASFLHLTTKTDSRTSPALKYSTQMEIINWFVCDVR